MYAELHCLSNFSFQRGASHPRELVETAKDLGYQALAITDECSVAGVVRAWEAAKEVDFPLIIGSEFQLTDGPKLVLLAPSQLGYEQLCALITQARRRSTKGKYRIELADLGESTGELLALWIPRWPKQSFDDEALLREAKSVRDRFQGRSWIAWERHLHSEDRERHETLGAISRHLGMPLVAAGDVHYHVRERQPLQDVLTCVRAHTTIYSPGAPLFPNGERFLRPFGQLTKCYTREALAESIRVVERCHFRLDQLRYRKRRAFRDVGMALGFSMEHINELAKATAYWDDGAALQANLARVGFDLTSRRVQLWLMLTQQLRGFPRHMSQHPGGFVLSNRPISTLVPIENAAMEDRTIIQWDKDDLDAMGLLKVDVLALGMLSAIRRTLDLMSRFHGKTFRMQDIPAEDPKTYDMISRGETTGVFQIESRAQMSMLPRMKPRTFWDLVVEVAIIRPGPIQGDMVHPYLRRRQGLEPVSYPSAELEQVLGCTMGVPLFQEQVMQVAMVAAGFDAGEADKVRRSMAAWKRKGGLTQYREKLIRGMGERGYSPAFAEQIYQQILGFGSYGFPMSHAASFALLTYVSCWMRCHEPAAFCAALLNSQPMGFYGPAQLVNDTRRSGVRFRSPDVLHSHWDCTLECDETANAEVRLGLRQIAGLAESEGQRLVAERLVGGPFASVDDMAQRVQLNRRSLSCLADAGALKSLSGHRHAARWAAAGVHRMDEVLKGGQAKEKPTLLPPPRETQDLVADYRSLGLTLGRHPMAVLRSRFDRERVVRSDRLKEVADGAYVNVAGIVTHRQRPETATGVVFASLEDEAGITNLIIWAGVMEQQREAILGSQLMLVKGQLQAKDGVIHIVTRKAMNYNAWLGELTTSSRDFH